MPEVKDFDAEALVPKAYIKNLALFGQYAFAAAQEALEMSNLEIDPFRTGIVMGTAMDGCPRSPTPRRSMTPPAGKRCLPGSSPKILGNMAPVRSPLPTTSGAPA